MRELGNALRGGPCTAYANNLRVHVTAYGEFFYPNIVVVCGRPKLADAAGDMVTEATVIIEVLSDSTEKFDRGGGLAASGIVGRRTPSRRDSTPRRRARREGKSQPRSEARPR